MFLGRHSLEHVKLGSSGVKEKQEQLLLNTKQHMESHLYRGQVLGNKKKKKPEICSKFLQKRNSYEPTLNIFSQKSKIKMWHTQACCPEIPLKAAQRYHCVLPRDATVYCPEIPLCATQRCHCTLPMANSIIFKQKYWQSYTLQVQVLIKIIFQVSLLLCMCSHMGMYLCRREGVYMCMHGWRELVSSSITLCLFACLFILRQGLSLTLEVINSLDCLTLKPQGSPCPCSFTVRIIVCHVPLYPVFICGY